MSDQTVMNIGNAQRCLIQWNKIKTTQVRGTSLSNHFKRKTQKMHVKKIPTNFDRIQ